MLLSDAKTEVKIILLIHNIEDQTKFVSVKSITNLQLNKFNDCVELSVTDPLERSSNMT